MKVYSFGVDDPLAKLSQHDQAAYLRCYLSDLRAKWVLEELRYFDRDYLDEHSAYYASVAAQYPNVCSRLHFFDGGFSEKLLNEALAGDRTASSTVERAYLGFSVVRPLPHAPCGRTVVKWYPDEKERYGGNPRITTPSRDYFSHVAGLTLGVRGLAWQQQDGAVALCATTALWSMLHSSAFDDHHAIPTTSTVTRFAYGSLRDGVHVFPAVDGLENPQIVEAIARARLTPLLLEGDAQDGFSKELFSATVATLIRSGYPVLLSGVLDDRGGHLVCVTGFRETGASPPHQDAGVDVFYVHDDNLGPNVREEIELDELQQVKLRPVAPPRRYPGAPLRDPAADYPAFRPEQLIAGVHEGLHMRPHDLDKIGQRIVQTLEQRVDDGTKLNATVRFSKVATYAGEILPEALTGNGLREVRYKLAETLPPMSLHIGVVRVGAAGRLVADVLIDASDVARLDRADSSMWWRGFGTIVYLEAYEAAFQALATELSMGVVVTDAAV